MKKDTPTVIAVIACILTVICLVQIFALKNQINNMQVNINNQIGNIDSTIRNIYSNVDNLLEEKASLLSDSSYEYGSFNADDMTVELLCTVTPKEYSPNSTTATLVCGGGEYPMTLNSGDFGVTFSLPVFAQDEAAKVQFETDGVVQTEILKWTFSPHYEFLPNVYARFNGSGSGGTSYHCEGTVNIDVESKEPFEVQSITLIEVLDGKEINRTPIDPNENVKNQDNASPEPAYEEDGRLVHTSHALDETYEIPNGSTHELYIEVVDGYNLYHRTLIDRWIVDKDGNAAPDEDDWVWRGAESNIYDASGHLLYDAYKNISY